MREFIEKRTCPNCGFTFTNETAFSRWVRHHPEVQDGFFANDIDGFKLLNWLMFKSELNGRAVQFMMDIEVKEHGALPKEGQRDAMYIRTQLLRNRRNTPTKKTKHQAGRAPLWVWSPTSNRKIRVWSFGVYLLQFSDTCPEDSKWIKWNKQDITEEILIKLLRFEIDPDTLKPMTEILRKHHRKQKDSQLYLGWEK